MNSILRNLAQKRPLLNILKFSPSFPKLINLAVRYPLQVEHIHFLTTSSKQYMNKMNEKCSWLIFSKNKIVSSPLTRITYRANHKFRRCFSQNASGRSGRDRKRQLDKRSQQKRDTLREEECITTKEEKCKKKHTPKKQDIKFTVNLNNVINELNKKKNLEKQQGINKINNFIFKPIDCRSCSQKKKSSLKNSNHINQKRANSSYSVTKKMYPRYEKKQEKFQISKSYNETAPYNPRVELLSILGQNNDERNKISLIKGNPHFFNKRSTIPLFLLVKCSSDKSIGNFAKNIKYKVGTNEAFMKVYSGTAKKNIRSSFENPNQYLFSRLNNPKTKFENDLSRPQISNMKKMQIYRYPASYSADSNNQTTTSVLAVTIYEMLKPLIEQEYLQYKEVKEAIERIERNLQFYIDQTRTGGSENNIYESLSNINQFRTIQSELKAPDKRNVDISDPKIHEDISDPLETNYNKEDPTSDCPISDPSIVKHKISDPIEYEVTIFAKDCFDDGNSKKDGTSGNCESKDIKENSCQKEIEDNPCKQKTKATTCKNTQKENKNKDQNENNKNNSCKQEKKSLICDNTQKKDNEKDCFPKSKKDTFCGDKKIDMVCEEKSNPCDKKKECNKPKQEKNTCGESKTKDPCEKTKKKDECGKKQDKPSDNKCASKGSTKPEVDCFKPSNKNSQKSILSQISCMESKKRGKDFCPKTTECKGEPELRCEKKDPCENMKQKIKCEKKRTKNSCASGEKHKEEPCKQHKEDICKKSEQSCGRKEDPCKQYKSEKSDQSCGRKKDPCGKQKSSPCPSAGKDDKGKDKKKCEKENSEDQRAKTCPCPPPCPCAETCPCEKTKDKQEQQNKQRPCCEQVSVSEEAKLPIIKPSCGDAKPKLPKCISSCTEPKCVEPTEPPNCCEPWRKETVVEQKPESKQIPCHDILKKEEEAKEALKKASKPASLPPTKKTPSKCKPPSEIETRYCPKPVHKKEYVPEQAEKVPRPKIKRSCESIIPPLPKPREPQQSLKESWSPFKIKDKNVLRKIKSAPCSRPAKPPCSKPKAVLDKQKCPEEEKSFIGNCKGLLSSLCRVLVPGKKKPGEKAASTGLKGSKSLPDSRGCSKRSTLSRSTGNNNNKKKPGTMSFATYKTKNKYPWRRTTRWILRSELFLSTKSNNKSDSCKSDEGEAAPDANKLTCVCYGAKGKNNREDNQSGDEADGTCKNKSKKSSEKNLNFKQTNLSKICQAASGDRPNANNRKCESQQKQGQSMEMKTSKCEQSGAGEKMLCGKDGNKMQKKGSCNDKLKTSKEGEQKDGKGILKKICYGGKQKEKGNQMKIACIKPSKENKETTKECSSKKITSATRSGVKSKYPWKKSEAKMDGELCPNQSQITTQSKESAKSQTKENIADEGKKGSGSCAKKKEELDKCKKKTNTLEVKKDMTCFRGEVNKKHEKSSGDKKECKEKKDKLDVKKDSSCLRGEVNKKHEKSSGDKKECKEKKHELDVKKDSSCFRGEVNKKHGKCSGNVKECKGKTRNWTPKKSIPASKIKGVKLNKLGLFQIYWKSTKAFLVPKVKEP
ncbi:hypothetical protein JTB14_011943 [Gonioctena quinquepunctata]|nr:hypothetical protein JTB14_011943 [Gonioctena quinquepunctata]